MLLALSSTTSYRFLAPCQNLEHFSTVGRKDGWTEEQMEGQNNGQTHFWDANYRQGTKRTV